VRVHSQYYAGRSFVAGALVLAALFVGTAGCSGDSAQPAKVDLGPAPVPAQHAAASVQALAASAGQKEFNPRLLRRFRPLPEDLRSDQRAPTDAQVNLGRQLYFETRISKNGKLSCNSCHPLDRYGADGESTSLGHDSKRGSRNSPTVYHAAGFFAQFWDGRAGDVEEQAKGPILNPIEMGMTSGRQVEQILANTAGYKEAFREAFPGEKNPLTYDNVGKAIGAFERGLVTPSRWDLYLAGDKGALTPAEVEGLRVFTNVGCMVCHTGAFVGGSMFAKVGAVEPWPNQADQGRYEVTKMESDRMMFKVPSLRNVEKTAPYFHDASASTLDEAVRKMGRHQLGLDLTDGEVASIATWLKSLTGTLPAEYIKPPPDLVAAAAHP
jgi:cytochrome c peroxidase